MPLTGHLRSEIIIYFTTSNVLFPGDVLSEWKDFGASLRTLTTEYWVEASLKENCCSGIPPNDSLIPIYFRHWIKLLWQEIKHLSGSVVFCPRHRDIQTGFSQDLVWDFVWDLAWDLAWDFVRQLSSFHFSIDLTDN